jgi:hypothetical protein
MSTHHENEAFKRFVQLARDDEVQYTWPVHLATLFAQMSCRVVLVAICPDPDIAEWAAKPIVVGPGFELRPLVFGPDHVAGLPAAARRHLDAWSTTQDREHQCAATASFRHGCADRRNGPSDRRFARAGGAGLRSPRGLRGRATRRQAVCWLCVAHDRGESTPMITVD